MLVRRHANIWTSSDPFNSCVYVTLNLTHLTHCGRDKMAAILQTTCWNSFPSRDVFVFCHVFFKLRIQLIISWHKSTESLGTNHVTSHYLNKWCCYLWTHICVTRPRWVKIPKRISTHTRAEICRLLFLKVRWRFMMHIHEITAIWIELSLFLRPSY